jgi:HAE1 family hydrophobic/amphiphilic exporter-1
LSFFLKRRLELVLGVLAVFMVTSAVAFKEVKFVGQQEEERGGFELNVRLPNSTTLEEAEQYFLDGEKIIESMQAELDLDGWFLFHGATRGSFQGWFNSPRTNELSPREATKRVLEALPEVAGVKVYTNQDMQGDSKKNANVHKFRLEGDDADILEQVAEELEEVFVRVEGVIGMKNLNDEAPSEMALVLDRDRAQSQGINPTSVATVIGYALRGQTLPRFRRDGKEIPVTVRFKEEDRDSLAELNDFQVPAADDAFVKLSSLTEPRYLASSRRIFRNNKKTSREITLELEDGQEEETRMRLMALAAGINLPEGVAFGGGHRQEGMDEDVAGMLFAGIVSIVFIYLLMGFLFESFILPLSIILTIPLASLGVYWAHFIMDKDIDFLGVVGLILLIGVVVNNGIVLIDYVTRLRHDGIERTEALVLAAERRFRPIMMTALTTIGGMIPLTLTGSSSIGMSYTSFGLTLIGGLTTATLLTLLVVPLFYTFFDDARNMVGRVLRNARTARGLRGSNVAQTDP